ncbi:hypothetical protein KW837_04265 [Pseudomonas sp. PDM24]|jgi:hypothetical protein|uniref:hypothetical protein n=1 Tax=Pseudomonas sp. PDM24 TaxID=2854777 RepID=UPI001C47FE3F|nr:hypothetical protein [Pseudomonas sp. PDM24]MBV7493477.1 hypothetical protein [Pseudomonas sp. PDM24]
MLNFERYNDELMGFVLACLFCEAISKTEFQIWCVQNATLENAPYFLYDLMEFDDEIFKIYQIIGRVPYWEHSDDEEYALYGIAVRRGMKPYDMPLSLEEALEKLEAAPMTEQAFRQTFSFIEL